MSSVSALENDDHENINYLIEREILSTTNITVKFINEEVLKTLKTEEKMYHCADELANQNKAAIHAIEFLNNCLIIFINQKELCSYELKKHKLLYRFF